jgi:hypothetical protein
MAFRTFHFQYKLYAEGTLTRSNIFVENEDNLEYPDIFFPLGSPARLVEVTAQAGPLKSDIGKNMVESSASSADTLPINYQWQMWGDFILGKEPSGYGKLMLDSVVEQFPASFPSPIRVFEIPYQRLYMSNFNPVYHPICTYTEGFRFNSILITFGASYTLRQAYFGRLRMSFTFEV